MTQRAHQRDRRQGFTDGDGVQHNAAWFQWMAVKTVTFTPAFSIGRSLTSAHPEPYPDQRLNKVEKGGVKQFEHNK